LWCISRLGARELFYGPINQVLPPGTATRWIEALLNVDGAGEALASLARHTGDPTRDVSPAVFEKVRAKLTSEKLIAILEGQEARDEGSMGRIFGEALPSGLVLGA
ncbi:MAG: Heat shock protein 70, partial [Bryobacterales bacterium]|nr:Heat shock protein 70 [Bryobacterales bacterium]